MDHSTVIAVQIWAVGLLLIRQWLRFMYCAWLNAGPCDVVQRRGEGGHGQAGRGGRQVTAVHLYYIYIYSSISVPTYVFSSLSLSLSLVLSLSLSLSSPMSLSLSLLTHSFCPILSLSHSLFRTFYHLIQFNSQSLSLFRNKSEFGSIL